MAMIKAVGICLMLSLGMVITATAQTTVCATDTLNGGTILLRTDSNLVAGAAVGLNGWLSRADLPLMPLYGTAVVDSKGTSMRIGVQSLKNGEGTSALHQHMGILVTTDLALNGNGSFESLIRTGAMPQFQFDTTPVTWVALNPCPPGP